MIVRFWGSRGSIPVPDSRMIKYGGNTTCVEINIDKKVLIIDAGTGIRKLGESLVKRDINKMDIIITHSHWDHIQGFPFFKPAYSPKTKINFLGCTNSYKRLKEILSQQMSVEYFPIEFSELKADIVFSDTCTKFYNAKDFKLEFIETNHPIFTFGVKIIKGRKAFVYITDNELESPDKVTKRDAFVDFCKDATYLIHDAQFTDQEYIRRKGWGHSTYSQIVKLAQESNVKNLGFTHHDPNRKDEELALIEKKVKDLCKRKKLKFSPFIVKEHQEILLGSGLYI